MSFLKRTICFYFICFVQHNGFAQFVTLSAGCSQPSGSYASKDINQNSAAFAGTGFMYQASFTHKPQNFLLGFSALIRHQQNELDVKGYENGLTIKYPSIVWTANSTPYKSNFFMIGTYSPFLLDSGRTSIHLRFMVGAASCTLPQISVSGQQGNAYYWKKGGGSSALSSAYLIGIGFKYNIGSQTCLLIDLDYLGAKPEFKDVRSIDSNGIMQITSLSQSISTYNISLGIGIRL